MPWSTSANRSGLVDCALVHSSLPVLSNRLTDAARGRSERTSCAYGSMEFSKDIHPRRSPIRVPRTLMQLAFPTGRLGGGALEPGTGVDRAAGLPDFEVQGGTRTPARVTYG